jgi:hypothetical protein
MKAAQVLAGFLVAAALSGAHDGHYKACMEAIVNSPTEAKLTIKADHGATNRKLLARQAAADLTRIESASRKISIHLSSPEGKRLYLRCFDITQMNLHFIAVFARMKLPGDDVDKVEQELRQLFDSRLARLNQSLVDMEAKCQANGILNLATYDVEPMPIEAKVYSTLGRLLLEMIGKVDQLMPMLETLCIDEAISPNQLSIEKSRIKKNVRGAAGATRMLRMGLEKRLGAITSGGAEPQEHSNSSRG